MNAKNSRQAAKADSSAPMGGLPGDPARAAFTSAIVAALEELESRKTLSACDLGQIAYHKLQYDLPLVSTDELEGLAHTLRNALQIKSGESPFPLTSKLLENIVAGARAPLAITKAPIASGQPQTPEAGPLNIDTATQPGSVSTATLNSSGLGTSAGAGQPEQNGTAGTPEPSQETNSVLLHASPLESDRSGLCTAYRGLCAVVFVQLVSHCLTVSERDTWILLSGIHEADEAADEEQALKRQSGEEEGAGLRPGFEASSEPVLAPEPGSAEEAGYEGRAHRTDGTCGARSQSSSDAGATESQAATVDVASTPADEVALGGHQLLGGPQQPVSGTYEAEAAAEEDGDDFVFEDLETPGTSGGSGHPGPAAEPGKAAANGWGHSTSGRPAAPPPQPKTPYTWPALRQRLLQLASQVSYVLLDDPDLWRDGELLQGVFQLLRALGAHRHAQELQPLLHAYVGLVADRLAAAPEELGCLESLWDAVGVPCIASLPQQVGRARVGGGRGPGSQLLLAEATTCLSLVASLSGQLSSTSAKLRLWQQVHKHMLPLLERCLGELARAVGPGKPAGNMVQVEPRKSPGPEEVAAIVLVCQVLDFYVQQRPGNADLGAALKGTGVLASLSVLFAAAADLPGAEPLRSAALCCAASSWDLHSWMVAVPGVAQAVAGPPYREAGPYEAHGAVWELLGNGGASPLALSILSGGAAPETAVRVHALLQLLSQAAACRSGEGGASGTLWGPALDRALRSLFASLREGLAAGTSARGAAGAENSAGCGSRAQEQVRDGPGAEAQGANPASGADVPGAAEEGAPNELDDDDDKLHVLDTAALQRRRARQLQPACWRILKQLLSSSGGMGGKTD